ncbi:MAG TPA: NeuD/PglB/VioB family sugar acetyltransferase [Paludibacter sp.]|nr:NeuD/PglB/VioB family sugar acetyltransferase [Paludibacter sp.]HPM08904.1 NeuD/PglB/VioB family sugar acetyltransferase [Paludibacter sp.]
MEKIVIVGSGGFGCEVLDLIEMCNKAENIYDPIGFIVDSDYGKAGTLVHDVPILGDLHWLEKNAKKVKVVVAIGAPHLRFRMVRRLEELNCEFINIIHPWTKEHLNKWVTLGKGIILNGCQTSNQIHIGNHVFVNAFGVVGHDVTVMDFCTFGPGVNLDGNVTIGMGCFIGTGSNVLPKVKIGEWSIIGAGSVISKDIPANSVAINLPPRIINQMDEGWYLTAEE